METIPQLIEELQSRDNNAACRASSELCRLSGLSDEVYPYFDLFASLLSSKNSLARNRGLALVAANARWDGEGRVEALLPAFLSHITDEKPITSRQCIKALPQLCAAKPELRTQVRQALQGADCSAYADSMRPLVLRDIIDALKKI